MQNSPVVQAAACLVAHLPQCDAALLADILASSSSAAKGYIYACYMLYTNV